MKSADQNRELTFFFAFKKSAKTSADQIRVYTVNGKLCYSIPFMYLCFLTDTETYCRRASECMYSAEVLRVGLYRYRLTSTTGCCLRNGLTTLPHEMQKNIVNDKYVRQRW